MEYKSNHGADIRPADAPINALIGAYHQQFQAMLNVISCGLYIADPDGRVVYWNQAAEKITGLGAGEVLGKRCREIFRCDQQDLACRLDIGSSAHGELVGKEVVLEVNGRLRYLYKKSNPIHATQGEEWVGIAVSFIDMTPQREAESAIQEARELVESTRQAKRHFMANMSHEIRTPINGILGVLDLLLTGVTTPAQRAHLMTARKSARLLMNLIGDLLDFSIINKGEIPIEQTGFSLRSVIASVIARQHDLTHNKEVAIHSHMADEVPDNLLGDPGRLYQILKHVVGNGLKFTSAGEVTVRVKTNDAVQSTVLNDQRHVIVHFSVSDTGMGIPQEKLDSIFEAFSQVDASSTRAAGGLGIGLNIVNRLIELQGGHIWIESQLARGTTVHFTLPFRKAFDEETSLTESEAADGSNAPPASLEASQDTDRMAQCPPGQRPEMTDSNIQVPIQMTAEWHSKYNQIKALVRNDPNAAEALLKELKEETSQMNCSYLASLLFRLLIAVRRDNEERIKQHMDHIDSALGDGAVS